MNRTSIPPVMQTLWSIDFSHKATMSLMPLPLSIFPRCIPKIYQLYLNMREGKSKASWCACIVNCGITPTIFTPSFSIKLNQSLPHTLHILNDPVSQQLLVRISIVVVYCSTNCTQDSINIEFPSPRDSLHLNRITQEISSRHRQAHYRRPLEYFPS